MEWDEMITDIIDVDHTAITLGTLAAAKAAGLAAIIAKCSEGKDFVDPSYSTWRTNAKVHDVLFGAYHFGTNSCDGAKQADWFLAHALTGPGDLLVLDWEWNPHHEVGDMTLANAEAFVQRVFEKTGRYPVVYTSRSFAVHDRMPEPDSVLSRCPLWVCWYGEGPPHLPISPWRDYLLWQYTNGGAGPHDAKAFPRITRGVTDRKFDRSAFRGSAVDLAIAWQSAGWPTQ